VSQLDVYDLAVVQSEKERSHLERSGLVLDSVCADCADPALCSAEAQCGIAATPVWKFPNAAFDDPEVCG
jgi:hypothetical protein